MRSSRVNYSSWALTRLDPNAMQSHRKGLALSVTSSTRLPNHFSTKLPRRLDASTHDIMQPIMTATRVAFVS